VDNLGPLGNSDHVMLLISTNFYVKNVATSFTKYDWKNADYVKMENELNNVDWDSEITEVHQGWSKIREAIDRVTEKYVPKVIIKGNSQRPIWMNNYLVRLRRKKSRLYKKMKKNNCEQNVSNFNKVSKEFKKAVRRAKRKVEVKISKQTGNVGQKKFSSYVKSKLSKNTEIGPLMKDGQIVTDNQRMANILNEYFSSVFNRDVPVRPVRASDIEEKLDDIVITRRDVTQVIDDLKNGKAPGPDGIGSAILKNLKDALVKPLQKLFQLSVDTGEVPSNWKEAKVIPIFKKGSKGQTSNYRPVSLTCMVCKLLEAIIRKKVTDHLMTNNLLKKSQHGFMKSRSCQTNLLEFMDRICQIIDSGKPVDVVYLDFSKAFDKISHAKLINKLESHGITGKVKGWIKEWLSNRKQWVSVNGSRSEEKDVSSGVPQGSVLGPLLFILYINDMDQLALIIDLLRKFADDTKCAKVVEKQEDADLLQQCLDDLLEWSQTWSMEFNIAKCKVMHFGHNNKKFNYNINGVQLGEVSNERDIGVCINSNLKPSKQCHEAANKARAVLGQISWCFHYRDRNVFLRLYKQYVRSHLEFSSSVWSPWAVADIAVLENVQKKAVGMISGLRANDYDGKLEELGLWTLEKRREMFDMIQVYKIAHGIGEIETSLEFCRENGSRVTRNRVEPLNLVKQRSNLEVKRNFFCDRVVDKWNAIPSEVKNSTSVARFKNGLVKLMSQ
jgi:hypothetical protein